MEENVCLRGSGLWQVFRAWRAFEATCSEYSHTRQTYVFLFLSLLSYSIVRKRTPAHTRDVISRSADVTTWASTCGSICQIIVDLFVIVDCAISHAIHLFFTFTCLRNLLPTSATMSTPDSLSPTSANDDESTRIHIAVRALDDMRSRVSVPNSGESKSGADQQLALLTFDIFCSSSNSKSQQRRRTRRIATETYP